MTSTKSAAVIQFRPGTESAQSSPRPVRMPMRELTLDELLASPLVHRMMERDGVNARSLRAMIVSIACARQGE
jgi:hypothetical protein